MDVPMLKYIYLPGNCTRIIEKVSAGALCLAAGHIEVLGEILRVVEWYIN